MSDFVSHQLLPEYDSDSRVLILGTIPSPKSREYGFYYMHPQNRFWRALYDVFETSLSSEIAARKQFLHQHRIALWDVLASCEIAGASDASIRNPVPNDQSLILRAADIRQIFVTGKTAERFYNRLCRPSIGRECICLPSPSPANCAVSYEKILAEYRKIRVYTEE